jgi:hypothetical protein
MSSRRPSLAVGRLEWEQRSSLAPPRKSVCCGGPPPLAVEGEPASFPDRHPRDIADDRALLPPPRRLFPAPPRPVVLLVVVLLLLCSDCTEEDERRRRRRHRRRWIMYDCPRHTEKEKSETWAVRLGIHPPPIAQGAERWDGDGGCRRRCRRSRRSQAGP